MNTAASDFHALQIPDEHGRVIAAGIPWFATMFGRDSIIAAYQSLSLNPSLAKDTLRTLAKLQGTEYNDWKDEEPGKILHEYRQGEMTRSGEMPFGPYFGTIDATPLFLILLSETYNWTADEDLVRELLPAAYKALDWIDKYGDLDGDGLVEYLRRSKRGLANQGWKDSWDANVFRDGNTAQPPIALVEVQGYVYDAKYRMASLLRAFGDAARGEKCRREALEMAKRLEKAFWMPQRGFYAMALDKDKAQLEVISSNPGHLLFSRAIGRERARAVVNRLMRADMFSGWGLRTLSNEERVFNPLSYHRGSVWPHDNSLIVHGMALYEFRAPVIRIFTTLFEAALSFRDYRLPELFCGVQRSENGCAGALSGVVFAAGVGVGLTVPDADLDSRHPAKRAEERTQYHQSAIAGVARSSSSARSPRRQEPRRTRLHAPRRTHLLQRGRYRRRQVAGECDHEEVSRERFHVDFYPSDTLHSNIVINKG